MSTMPSSRVRFVGRPRFPAAGLVPRPGVADRGSDPAPRLPAAAAMPAARQKERIGWLDSARGFGIVLVVLGHALGGLIDSPLGAGQGAFRALFFAIYACHMPLFFLLAGLTVPQRLERGTCQFLRALWPGIVAPYFLWSVIQFTVIWSLGSAVNNPVAAFWPTILALPWQTVSQYWFLYVLFWLHLAAAALLPRLGTRGFLLLACALRVAGPLLALPVIARLLCVHALFYALGLALRPEGLARLVVNRGPALRLVVVPVAAAVTLGLTAAALPVFGADLPFATATSPQLANLAWRWPVLPAAALMVAAVIGLAGLPRLAGSTVLARLGRSTMPIFLLHVLFVAGGRIVLLHLGLVGNHWLLALSLTAGGLIGPLLVAALARRLGLPRLIGF